MPSHERPYLIAEVAAIFRVNKQTVTRWIRLGRLPSEHYFITPGGHIRIYQSGVDFIAEQQ